MKVEYRSAVEGKPDRVLLICENNRESLAIDALVGARIQDKDGFIAKVKGEVDSSKVKGEVRLSSGYCEHYISLERG